MTGWGEARKTKKGKSPLKSPQPKSRKVHAGQHAEEQQAGTSSSPKTSKPPEGRKVEVKPKLLRRSSSEGSAYMLVKQKNKEAQHKMLTTSFPDDYSEASLLDTMSSWLGRLLGLNATPHSMDKILPFLFLGNDHAASHLPDLRKAGITHVCNVATQCNDHFPDHFEYLHLHLFDSPTQKLAKHIKAAGAFIHRAKHTNGRVLVHCVAGVSRSVCVVVAYLVEHCHMPLVQAYDYVKRKRPVMCPSESFRMQLAMYEIALFESSSVLSTSNSDWDFYELNMYRQTRRRH